MSKRNMNRIVVSAVLALALLCVSLLPAGVCAGEAAEGAKPLVIASDGLDGTFLPFFNKDGATDRVCDLIQIQLMYSDRDDDYVMKGIQGEKKKYKGKQYTYHTPADLDFHYGKDGTCTYDFTLRDDLRFSDGEPLTADDVIFSMYVLSDPDYTDTAGLKNAPILGLEDYLSGKADYIEGIQKIDDTHLRVVTTDSNLWIEFRIAPLHYYGDPAQYDYDAHHFGFPKGDLSAVREKSGQPMGAGPYRFVSFEDGKVTLEANPYYYQGEPKIQTVVFDSAASAFDAEAIPEGRTDVVDKITKKMSETVKAANGGKKLDGKVVAAREYDYLGYGYIGINANLVNVGGEPGSEASKALRKAFATLFSVYREEAIDAYYGDTAVVNDYPCCNFVWAAPQPKEKGYRVAFSTDANGEAIYTKKMKEPEQKYEAALQAALGFFEKAGYTVEDGKLTAAPEGASLEYTFVYTGKGSGEHPAALLAEKVSAALQSIGIKLNIKDQEKAIEIFDGLERGQVQMWAGAVSGGHVTQLTNSYYSDAANGPSEGEGKNPAGGPAQGASNVYYGIADPELDQKLLDAWYEDNDKKSAALYKEAMEMAMDWGVEVPFYQRKSAALFSAERINVKTIPDGLSPYYSWMREIENLEMK